MIRSYDIVTISPAVSLLFLAAHVRLCDLCDQRVLRMANEFKDRLTGMIGEWIRVGFCQGNFNADNCLVGGRTMDYGPFGTR